MSEPGYNWWTMGERAMRSPYWRWMPGMFTMTGERVLGHGKRGVIVDRLEEYWNEMDSADGYLAVAQTRLAEVDPKLLVPNLQDPATLGCLLELVRTAWNDPTICLVHEVDEPNKSWICCVVEAEGYCLRGSGGQTEAKALVKALEERARR